MPKKKKDGIDLTAKGKREPAWKKLGLTPEFSPSGNRKGFRDAAGNYIPERQFRKMVGTPIKGSQGWAERQEAKAKGIDFRPETPESILGKMKEAAKIPGMTLEQFTTGKAHEIAYSNRRTEESHNKYIDEQRREAIRFKEMAGTMKPKEAEVARRDLERHIRSREKLREIRDKLHSGKLPPGERKRLWKNFREEAAKLERSQKKLEKKGLVIMDDRPSDESLRYGYYHG